MKIVACGLKLLTPDHAQSQIDAFFEAEKYSNMVIGFDLVCEEDFNKSLADGFVDMIYRAKVKAARMGREFPLYLHCGESNTKAKSQLYDAILLGTKRIGHGFLLAQHPELQ